MLRRQETTRSDTRDAAAAMRACCCFMRQDAPMIVAASYAAPAPAPWRDAPARRRSGARRAQMRERIRGGWRRRRDAGNSYAMRAVC